MNCWVKPTAALAGSGMMAMDSSTEGETVRTAEFEATPPNEAEMEAVPSATDVASPLEPAALLTVATASDDEIQVAQEVRSCPAPPAVRTPVAVNCWFVPRMIEAFAGVIPIEDTDETVSCAVPVTDSHKAEIVVVPVAVEAVARPAATVATPVSDDDQAT